MLFACLLFIGFFLCLSLSGGVGGISRLPVTRRWGGNNEKQQIHCQSIEEIGRTTLPQKKLLLLAKSVGLEDSTLVLRTNMQRNSIKMDEFSSSQVSAEHHHSRLWSPEYLQSLYKSMPQPVQATVDTQDSDAKSDAF